jgi:hypothetical protein
MKLYLVSGGQQVGPYSLKQVNSAIAEGRIVADEYQAWHKGCDGWIPLAQIPGIHSAGLLPAGMTAPPPAPVQGDVTGGIVPYKNPPALLAYYFGIFGLIPFLGIPFAVAAIVFGILGLKRRRSAPVVRGQVHAWIGIVLGSLSILGHLILGAVLIIMRAS